MGRLWRLGWVESAVADEQVRLLDMRVQAHAFLKVADQRDDRDLRKRELAPGFGGITLGRRMPLTPAHPTPRRARKAL